MYKSFMCVPNQFFPSAYLKARNLTFQERSVLVHVLYSISLYFVHLKYPLQAFLSSKVYCTSKGVLPNTGTYLSRCVPCMFIILYFR
jgi:hypothetical protein